MRAEAVFEITGWDGSSVAEVLTAESPAGPAAYTAQERFTGSFAGRTGSFVAQHGATSLADDSRWVIVDGTGAGELSGPTGTARLDIDAEGTHRIVFDYELG